MELNIPEVLAEVTAAFDRYERALNVNEIGVLDESFWASPHTIRYGLGENLEPRKLLRTVITTFGRDFATANCEFQRERSGRRGRQSQTWARTPHGWRVVSAHVSWMP